MLATEIIQLIKEVILLLAGLIPAIIATVKFIKSSIKNKEWAQICEIIKSAVTATEEVSKIKDEIMTSEEKLNYAMEIINNWLKMTNIPVDNALTDRIKAYITDICQFTKKINVK